MEDTNWDVLEGDELIAVPDEKLPFQHWLRKQLALFYRKQLSKGRAVKQAAFAKYLGITTYNLSQYLSGNRKPAARIAQEMAKKLGPTIFDKLDLPRSIPKDKLLLWIVDHWHLLDEAEQKELIERAKNMRDEKNAKSNRRDNGNSFA